MMKFLITGGAGFVGSSLAFALKRENPHFQVTALDNLKRRGSETNLLAFKEAGIHFVHGDIRNPTDLADLHGSFDLMIEASAEPSVLAGQGGSPNYVIGSNLIGTTHCLEFARKRVGCLVFLSTSRVYSISPLRELPLVEKETRFELDPQAKTPGCSAEGISESFPTSLPRSIYGATKLASEMLIQEYVHSYGLKAWINRCGVIAGAGQFGKTDQGIFTLWVAHHYFNRPLQYTGFGGRGKQVRDLLHPSDLFSLIQKQTEKIEQISGEIFNVGGGQGGSTSLLEFTQTCQKVVGKSISIASVPDTHSVDIPYYVSNTTKAENEFQWKPGYSVEKIVRDISEWIREREKILKTVFF